MATGSSHPPGAVWAAPPPPALPPSHRMLDAGWPRPVGSKAASSSEGKSLPRSLPAREAAACMAPAEALYLGLGIGPESSAAANGTQAVQELSPGTLRCASEDTDGGSYCVRKKGPQWMEHRPMDPVVPGSIPSRGAMCPGWGAQSSSSIPSKAHPRQARGRAMPSLHPARLSGPQSSFPILHTPHGVLRESILTCFDSVPLHGKNTGARSGPVTGPGSPPGLLPQTSTLSLLIAPPPTSACPF